MAESTAWRSTRRSSQGLLQTLALAESVDDRPAVKKADADDPVGVSGEESILFGQ